MRKPLAMIVTAIAAASIATSTAQARPNSGVSWKARTVTHLRQKIRWDRSMAWHYQDIAGVVRTHSERAENHTTSLPFLRWERHLWQHRRVIARRLAARRLRASSSFGWTGWDRVAACESGGGGPPQWSLVTGNGFYWGLQWVPSTWDSRAHTLGLPTWAWFVSHHAAPSRAMQIRAATGMSLSNWPVCGARY